VRDEKHSVRIVLDGGRRTAAANSGGGSGGLFWNGTRIYPKQITYTVFRSYCTLLYTYCARHDKYILFINKQLIILIKSRPVGHRDVNRRAKSRWSHRRRVRRRHRTTPTACGPHCCDVTRRIIVCHMIFVCYSFLFLSSPSRLSRTFLDLTL